MKKFSIFLVIIFFVAGAVVALAWQMLRNDSDSCLVTTQHQLLGKKPKGTAEVYLETSGFQEKVAFVRLYKQKPAFDLCGQPKTPAAYEQVVEDHKFLAGVLIKDEQLLLKYKEQSAESTPPKIEVIWE